MNPKCALKSPVISATDHKSRDAMAMAAAPYLHPKLSAIDAKLALLWRRRPTSRPLSWFHLWCQGQITVETVNNRGSV